MKFDTGKALKKSTLIRIFQDGLKPFIAAQIEQCGRENNI